MDVECTGGNRDTGEGRGLQRTLWVTMLVSIGELDIFF